MNGNEERRIVYFGQDAHQQNKHFRFPTNFIKTSKFTAYNYLILSFVNQLKKYANLYFIFIAILSSIPAISPLNPITAWAPLIFVLAVSMFREGLEDISRHR